MNQLVVFATHAVARTTPLSLVLHPRTPYHVVPVPLLRPDGVLEGVVGHAPGADPRERAVQLGQRVGSSRVPRGVIGASVRE